MYPLTPPIYHSFTCQVCGTSFKNDSPLSSDKWEHHKARWTRLINDEKSDLDFMSHLVEKPFIHNFHLKLSSSEEEVEVNISIKNKVLALLSTGIHCDYGYKIMALFENHVPIVINEYGEITSYSYDGCYIDISLQKITNPFGFFFKMDRVSVLNHEVQKQNILNRMKTSELIEINDSESLRVSESNMYNLCKSITETLDNSIYTLTRRML